LLYVSVHIAVELEKTKGTDQESGGSEERFRKELKMQKRALIVLGLIVFVILAFSIFKPGDDTRPGQPSPHAINQSQ